MFDPSNKYRHEYKYIISSAQLPLLINRVNGFMKLDSHAGEQGIYNIRSMYFDNYDNACFYENENGIDPREKFRIRIYNHSDNRISLECKQKSHDKTLKSSVLISRELTEMLTAQSTISIETSQPALLKKLILKAKSEQMKPKIIVEYERIPYIYKQGNVRVTFDTNISSSSAINEFFKENIPKRPIMPVGYHLMEVKFDEFLPDFIYQSLNLGQLQRTAYSKYYLSRKYPLY